jgi:hypothetical protein
METMQPRDTPLHINHFAWLLMQAGHFIFVYPPKWPKLAKIGRRDPITPPYMDDSVGCSEIEARSHDL